jgi:DNA-binding NarL/FixJ family response regulator
LLLARGEPDAALAALDALEALDRVAGAPSATTAERPVPRLARLRADALLALDRPADAGRVLRAARAMAKAEGLGEAQWYLGVAWSRLLLAQHRETEAAQVAQKTQALIERLADGVGDAELCTGFRARALAMLPPSNSPASRRARKAAFDGLTSREREVARLIGRRYSNRAIAETLVVSERTAETHVGNILGKLKFSSRAQIAVWINAKLETIPD